MNKECAHHNIRIRVYEETSYYYAWDPMTGELSGPDAGASDRDLSDVAVICDDCGEEWTGRVDDLKDEENGAFKWALQEFERAPR